MKKLSKFDLGVIIAFVVIGLGGGGGCYYFYTQLAAAKDQVSSAKRQFDQYSVVPGPDQTVIAVKASSLNVLQDNINTLKGLLDPQIEAKLLPKENKLSSVERQDPVTFKHNLVELVHRLTQSAKSQNIKLPDNFYFAFSRYVSQNPADDQTLVLGKQLVAVEELSNILISSNVASIDGISRSYEEGGASGSGAEPTDMLKASSVLARGGAYTAYPFEIEFNTNTEGFRKVVNGLVKSPYIFIIRSISVENSQPDSPKLDDLAKIVTAGTNPGASPSILSPGDTAAAASSNKGPVYLFGSALLAVKARVDLIEWNVPPSGGTLEPPPDPQKSKKPTNR